MPTQGESRYTLILDSRDAISNITKFKNSLNTAFANLPGIKQIEAQFNSAKQQLAQLGASVTNLEKLKTASTGAATEATKLANAEKTVATSIKEVDTGTKAATKSTDAMTKSTSELEKKTSTFGKKAESIFSKGGIAALGVSSLATGVLNLNKTFRDFGDVQIAVDKAQRRASLATEARSKAEAILRGLEKEGIKSGGALSQATLDYNQALEKERLAIQDVGERQEDAFDQQSQAILGVIQTGAGLGTMVGTLSGSFGKLKGPLGALKGAFTDLKIAVGSQGLLGTLTLLAPTLIKVGGIAAGTYGGLAASSKVLDANVKPTDDWRAALQKLISDGFDKIPSAAGAYKAFIQFIHDNVPGVISENEMIVLGLKDVAATQTDTTKATKDAIQPNDDLAKAKERYEKAQQDVIKAEEIGGDTLKQSAADEYVAAKAAYAHEQQKANLAKTTTEATKTTQDNTKALDMNALKYKDGYTVINAGNHVLIEHGGILKEVTTDIKNYADNVNVVGKTLLPYYINNQDILTGATVNTASAIKDLEAKMSQLGNTMGHMPTGGFGLTDAGKGARAAMEENIKKLQDQKKALLDAAKAQGVSQGVINRWTDETEGSTDSLEGTIAKIKEYLKTNGLVTKNILDAEAALKKETATLQLTAAAYASNATVMNSTNINLKAFNETIGVGIAELTKKRTAQVQAANAEKVADGVTRSSITTLEKEIISYTNLREIYDGSAKSQLALTNARIAGVESVKDLVTQSKLKAEQDKTELASLQKLVDSYHLKLPGSIYTSIESLEAIVKAQTASGEGALALGKIIDDQLAPAFQKFSSLLHETDFKQFKEGFKDLHLEKVFGKGGAKELQSFFNTLREGTVDVDTVSTAFEALKVAAAKGIGGEIFAKDAKKLGDAIQEIGELDTDGLTKPMEDFYAAIKKMTPQQLLQHAGSIQKFFEATNSPTGLTKEKSQDITDTFSKENTTNIGTMATNAGTLGEKLDTIAPPDITPFTSSLTDAANAAKLTASGVSTLKFEFPAPGLADYAQALKDSGTAAKLTASGIAGIKYNFPPPNISNAKSVMTDLYKWSKRIAGDVAGLKYKFPAPDIKSAKNVMNDLYSYAKRIVGDINGLKGTIHVSYSVDKKPGGLTSSAKGNVFPNSSIISAAQGKYMTTHGPQLMVIGDNPGGRETVAAIPHDNPGPTLAKVMDEFGSKISGGISGLVGGGGGMNNGEIIINIRNVNNDRETLRTFKAQMGRDTYKFGG